MAEIIARIDATQDGEPGTAQSEATVVPISGSAAAPRSLPARILDPERRSLEVTIDSVSHPAYMMSYNFELTWYNQEAREKILGGFHALPPDSRARNVFALLLAACADKSDAYRAELLRLHLALAKTRVSKAGVLGELRNLDRENAALIDKLYDESEAPTARTIVELPTCLGEESDARAQWTVYASFFREGIFIVFVPASEHKSTLLEFLSRRDVVIRNLMRKRLPVLTPLAVLVADLQNSVKICSELPPEEYFELINEIWETMGPIFRKYYGIYGKHVGDGMVYYFFPQPDTSYIMNALMCAYELKMEIRKISKKWQLRKNWLTELYLNTGLHEGQEWLGTFQSDTNVEFAVLGDTINHAARLSDFARFGAIWATKNFVGKLHSEERARVEFGIARRAEDEREHFVASSYSLLSGLIDLNLDRYEKLREIAALPVTEIRSVRAGPAQELPNPSARS